MTETLEMIDAAPVPRPHAGKGAWAALAMTALAVLIVGLDTTILNVALPTIGRSLGSTTSQLQWISDAYLLTLAVVMLPGGLLADRWGARPTMLVALALLGGGSAWCAFATSTGSLIAARLLLGAGAALSTPVAFSVVVVMFSVAERPKAMGALAGAMVVGMPLGPILGGWLLRHHDWGSVFLINLPVVAVALVGVALWYPRRGTRRGGGVDVAGVALAALGLSGLTYGAIEGPSRGWTNPWVAGALLVGALFCLAFVLWEERVGGGRAVMDMGLWRNRTYRWGAIAATSGNLVGFVALFCVPLYLQVVRGYDAFDSGLRTLPLLGGMIVGFVITGALGRFGVRLPLALGYGLLATGSALAALVTRDSGFGFLALWTALFGAGFGAVVMGGQNVAVDQLPPERAGAGGAAIQVLRQVGGLLGIAVLISILNGVYRARVAVTGLPAAVADKVRDSIPAGVAVGQKLHAPALVGSVRDSFLAGMRLESWVCAGLALAGLVMTLTVLPNARLGGPSGGHGR